MSTPLGRRDLLAGGCGLVGVLAAGCLDGEQGAPGGGGGRPATETPTVTTSDDETDPMMGDPRFEIRDISHPSRDETATVTFEDTTVTVTGVITGHNGCYTAGIDDVAVSNHELVVEIESFEEADEDEVCTEATVYIEYRTIVQFDSELPDAVTVYHDGEQVTERSLP